MNINKIIFSLAGATAAVASAIALIDYKRRRDCRPIKEPPVGELLFTFAAATGGAMMAAIANQLDENKHPERAEKLQKADDKLTELVTQKKQ
jgi:hypothetical protein